MDLVDCGGKFAERIYLDMCTSLGVAQYNRCRLRQGDFVTSWETHFGHSLVREETCCEAAQQASNLQGTHVWATCEEEQSDSQEIIKY